MTDAADDDPSMPDALEVAAAQDAQFARTGKLVGPGLVEFSGPTGFSGDYGACRIHD